MEYSARCCIQVEEEEEEEEEEEKVILNMLIAIYKHCHEHKLRVCTKLLECFLQKPTL